ncbi:MAG: hypothetical protein MUO52_11910 [Desulfobacterales bacterium]|nr:hypothetical protein [Desulfobacterales bacterium]
MKKIAYVGIDYHLNSLSIAVMAEGDKEPFETVHLRNEEKLIRKYMSKLSKEFEIRACYEASTNGAFLSLLASITPPFCDVPLFE